MESHQPSQANTEFADMAENHSSLVEYLMFRDALQALLRVVPLQRCAELSNQVFFMGLDKHPEVTQL